LVPVGLERRVLLQAAISNQTVGIHKALTASVKARCIEQVAPAWPFELQRASPRPTGRPENGAQAAGRAEIKLPNRAGKATTTAGWPEGTGGAAVQESISRRPSGQSRRIEGI